MGWPTVQFDRDEAIRRYQLGEPFSKLAKAFGVNHSTIAREVNSRQLLPRKRGMVTRFPIQLPPDPTTAAYIAGLIDADGSIGLMGKGQQPRAAIYNTSKELIDWLLAFGGRSHWSDPNKYHRDGHNRKLQCQWYASGSIGVYILLKAVLPYLVIKQAAANRIINELETRYPALKQIP